MPPVRNRPSHHSTGTKPYPTTPEARKSSREATKKATQASEEKARQEAMKPPAQHASAKSRAQEPIPGQPTSQANQDGVAALHKDKDYKNNTTRVHFKGERDSSGATSGNPVSGAHTQRSGWTPDQKAVNQHLGNTLSADSSFTPAPHANGTHGAEVAHVRRQAAGGLTDPLGAQPASVHTNIEDMAREEGMEKLRKSVGDDKVRLKSTTYVHEQGEDAGTMKARRDKLYVKNESTGEWEKKFDHLQDGRRGNIDKTEVGDLKGRVAQLDSSSPNAHLHGQKDSKGIPSGSSVQPQKDFVPTKNDSTGSPYFTDTKSSDGKQRTSADADAHMRELLEQGRKNIRG